jgi:hypothetical protein
LFFYIINISFDRFYCIKSTIKDIFDNGIIIHLSVLQIPNIMKSFQLVFICILTAATLSAQSPKETGLSAITKQAVTGQLEFLASDWMEGRGTGTRGEYLAADYIASIFQIYGIEPFGDETDPRLERLGMLFRNREGRRGGMPGMMPEPTRSYFQNIHLIEYKPGAEQTFAIINRGPAGENAVHFNYRTDFSVRTGNVGLSADAPVVFAGYGFTDEKLGYDDYRKLDVKGKVVLILSGFPGCRDGNSEAYKKFKPEGRFAEYFMERDKTDLAGKLGAIALIQVSTGDNPATGWSQNQIYPVKGRFYEADVPLRTSDSRLMLAEDTLSESLPVFTVTRRIVNQVIAGSEIDLAAFEKNVQEKMTPASRQLPGKYIAFKTTVESKIIRARNVLGVLEGEKKDEFIVIGAHYDHLGKTEGWIWNGADDNASGTVGVMTIAKAMAASGKKPEKSVVFAAWTGEERGLLGSEYFVQTFPKEKKIVLNLNYDMISRNEETDTIGNKAEMIYTEAFKGIRELTAKHITDYHINLDLSYKPSAVPRGGSDHAHFASAGIPVFYFTAAMHSDYHQPSDETSRVNWDKMTDIIRLGYLNIWEFANGDQYLLKSEKKE